MNGFVNSLIGSFHLDLKAYILQTQQRVTEKSQEKPWQANKTNLQKKLYSVTKKIVLAERVS
jgi:hypothetical protein